MGTKPAMDKWEAEVYRFYRTTTAGHPPPGTKQATPRPGAEHLQRGGRKPSHYLKEKV